MPRTLAILRRLPWIDCLLIGAIVTLLGFVGVHAFRPDVGSAAAFEPVKAPAAEQPRTPS